MFHCLWCSCTSQRVAVACGGRRAHFGLLLVFVLYSHKDEFFILVRRFSPIILLPCFFCWHPSVGRFVSRSWSTEQNWTTKCMHTREIAFLFSWRTRGRSVGVSGWVGLNGCAPPRCPSGNCAKSRDVH